MKKSIQCSEEKLAHTYDRYGPMLFRLCAAILCSRQDAEDAVQDVFAAYLKAGPSFTDGEHEKAWLIHVAENKCRDKRRSAFFRRTVSMETLEETAGDAVELHEEQEVLECLKKLPPRSRTVLYLHYVEGYKLREIAELLHIREGAAKAALYRGRELLRNKLKEEPA